MSEASESVNIAVSLSCTLAALTSALARISLIHILHGGLVPFIPGSSLCNNSTESGVVLVGIQVICTALLHWVAVIYPSLEHSRLLVSDNCSLKVIASSSSSFSSSPGQTEGLLLLPFVVKHSSLWTFDAELVQCDSRC